MESPPVALIIDVFICREDNYGYLVHEIESGKTAAIDAPDAGAIRARLDHLGWKLSDIFVTHHHSDHTEGIAPLKQAFGVVVTGPKAEAKKIKTLDIQLEPGDTATLGSTVFSTYATPGHTAGHIVYHDPRGGHLFTGDALFSIGCGRLVDAKSAPAMWEGLLALRELPDDTLIYCGHEYTVANAHFALTIEPKNPALRIRAAEVERMREDGKHTIPVSLGMEKATNPFLRADKPQIAQALGLSQAKAASVFAAVRKAKDNFKG
jgi:hydroxyacylglutathione hydrolase